MSEFNSVSQKAEEDAVKDLSRKNTDQEKLEDVMLIERSVELMSSNNETEINLKNISEINYDQNIAELEKLQENANETTFTAVIEPEEKGIVNKHSKKRRRADSNVAETRQQKTRRTSTRALCSTVAVIEEENASDTKLLHTCPECKGSFEDELEFKLHTCQGRTYICGACHSGFTRLCYLKRHVCKNPSSKNGDGAKKSEIESDIGEPSQSSLDNGKL